MAENPRIEELRRRVQADPASIAFAALAEEFRRTGRLEEAIETCRTGLQRHPAYLSARVTLGRALLETGDYAAAREELETVLRSAPENLAAIRGLEQITERLGHSTEMHPDLHDMMREPIRLAAERPPAPVPVSLPPPDLPPAPVSAPPRPEIHLNPFGAAASAAEPLAPADADAPVDIFAAALQQRQPAAPPAMAFEPATIAFEAPATVPAGAPDAHVAAMLTRLERFLGAIASARHA